MAIDFPSSPTEGQVLNVDIGNSFVFRDGFWQPAPLKTALPKNYIVNPSMHVSQEQGDAVVGPGAVGIGYNADMWSVSWGTSGGSIQSTRSRPSWTDSDYIVLQNNTAIDNGLPAQANLYAQLNQVLEGQRCADFGWGTDSGKQAIFRFDFYTNHGGFYSVQIKGGATTHTFLAQFFVVANIWQTFEFIVPPPPAGNTWGTANDFGIQVGIGLAAGSTYGGGVAGWQVGNKVTIAGNTNGVGTAASYLLTNAGFYLDPYLTGVAPRFQPPDFQEELRRCQRYWYRGFQFNGPVVAATITRGGSRHPVPMRTVPAATIIGAPKLYELSVTPTITSMSNAGNAMSADFQLTASAGGMTVGRAGVNFYNGEAAYIAMDARL